MTRIIYVGSTLLIAALLVPAAHGQLWVGTTSDWNTATNWSPATVPNSPTAAVTFGGNGLFAVNIASSVQAQSLAFTTSSGSYTLTSTTPQTLSGLTTITVGTVTTGTETINVTNLATGSLLFANAGSLMIADNSTSAATTLVIGPNTVIGTGGTGGVIVTGTGNVRISGSFATTNVVSGGLSKSGSGKLILSGDGSNLAGGLTLNTGTLQLDYTTNGASKLGSGGLTSFGGVLSVVANTYFAVTQMIPGGTTVSQNHTDIVASSAGGGNLTLALGSISRTAVGTLDISTGAGSPTFNPTTTTSNTNGLIGAFATASGGSTWATNSGGSIVGLTAYGTDTYASGVNTDVTTGNAPAGFTTNSLRFNTGGPTLALSVANTLQSGGILIAPGANGPCTITGGSLSVPGSGELIIHQYGGNVFTLASDLVAPGGLTKTGPGTMVLGGNNTGLTGPINISRGSLYVSNPAAVNSASQINFNDIRALVQQTFAVDLGVSATGTISTPIRLSAIGSSQGSYGTFFSTGQSYYSHVTLSGVISSAPGLNTPVYFVGDPINTSETDLTNVNTFTGNMVLGLGVLGITSDASLGNPANTLTLGVNSTVIGGLEFLNGGINVARTINQTGATRLISNGTDVNTISGTFSGTAGGLTKDGTGTLILEGPKSVTGLVSVLAGTLSLGATGTLNQNSVTVASGATFSPATAAGSSTFGVITLNGGTFRVTGGTGQQYLVNQIVGNAPGSTVDFSAAGSDTVTFNGGNPGIIVNANSTWLGAANGTVFSFTPVGTVQISVAQGVTLTNGIGFKGASQTYQVLGGGTLYQNSVASPGASVTASVKVTLGRYRVTDVSSAGGVGNLGTATFTLDGGTFAFGGSSATTIKPISLTTNGGTIEVESAATTLTENGAITGLGSLTKIGLGTLVLGSSGNTFSSLTIAGGTVQVANDAAFGPGTVTVSPLGTLIYSSTTTTTRSFNLGFGTLGVAAGQTLTLNGGSIGGGFLTGPGTLAVTGGAVVAGATTAGSLAISVTGPAMFANISNGASVGIAAGLSNPIGFTLVNNQGSGSVTVGAGSKVNASDFQTYGLLTLNPGPDASHITLLTNTGTSQMYFNGGSRTFIGTPPTQVGQFSNAGIDLNGKNAVVAGGLFVNNGYVVDSSNGGLGTGTVIADFGSLVKGAGFFQNAVITQNGGKFQAGNSPGSASFGKFVVGPGGVSNYVLAINDATGAAGPSPDALGHVSGWGLVKAVEEQFGPATTSGDFTWTATPADKLTVAIETLINPTTVGTDVAGPMAHFDPSLSYSWPAAQWDGSYSGPNDSAMLDAATNFNTTGFVNPVHGTFGWLLDTADQTLSLTYSPTAVPEPGTLALLGAAALAGWRLRRRR